MALLILAKSAGEFERWLEPVDLKPDTRYNLVDSTGEVWLLSVNEWYAMPTLRRKWSKKKIVQMYNHSKNCQRIEATYSERSLASKHFADIIAEIVALIEWSQ